MAFITAKKRLTLSLHNSFKRKIILQLQELFSTHLTNKKSMVLLQNESSNLKSMTLLSSIKFAFLSQEWSTKLRAKLLMPYLRNQSLLFKVIMIMARR